MHWAASLIGKPWAAGARGPEAYDCLGLVQHVVRTQLGVELPDVATVHESAWRPSSDAPREYDVALMTSISGRHIGIMVESGGKLWLLHANGTAARGSGSVMCQPLAEVARDGYSDLQIWRLSR